jgi:site-specific DNA recombinase
LIIKGIGYLRKSDLKQVGNHSEEIQKKMILAKAEQEGITIIDWRFDESQSAYRKSAGKRENMKMLITDAEEIDAILFYDESRLTRQMSDFNYEIYVPIKERFPHVKFYSTQSAGEWDPNDPLVQAKLVFAAEESRIKSQRAKDAQYSLLLNNDLNQPQRPGSRSPIGYDSVNGLLVPNLEASIVTQIFDFASWGHSNQTIADILNKGNVKTKFISKWHASTIDYILKNYVYAGHLSWNIKHSNSPVGPNNDMDFGLFEDIHEPIISPVMFSIVSQVKGYKKKYGKLDTPFFLRNLVCCSGCGSMLTTKDNSPKGKSQHYRVYRCPTCNVNIRASDIHKEVLSDLTKKWTSNLHQLIEESKKVLANWLKELTKCKSSIEETEERILFNERMLNQDVDFGDASLIIQKSKELISKEKQKVIQAIEKINLLNNDMALYEVYSHFKNADITKLLDTEKRTLCLTFIDEIKLTKMNYNFSLSIKYRLNPFVEIENSTVQITDELLKQLPGKPKDLKRK